MVRLVAAQQSPDGGSTIALKPQTTRHTGEGPLTAAQIEEFTKIERDQRRRDDDILDRKALANDIEAYCYDLRNNVQKDGAIEQKANAILQSLKRPNAEQKMEDLLATVVEL